ncbi:hypothetical protein OH77DRAFT_1427507 [Trametes cingulata]|nr:hypothetical protein OH77DRAFT_1427507 [Trametes cingulata]
MIIAATKFPLAQIDSSFSISEDDFRSLKQASSDELDDLILDILEKVRRLHLVEHTSMIVVFMTAWTIVVAARMLWDTSSGYKGVFSLRTAVAVLILFGVVAGRASVCCSSTPASPPSLWNATTYHADSTSHRSLHSGAALTRTLLSRD